MAIWILDKIFSQQVHDASVCSWHGFAKIKSSLTLPIILKYTLFSVYDNRELIQALIVLYFFLSGKNTVSIMIFSFYYLFKISTFHNTSKVMRSYQQKCELKVNICFLPRKFFFVIFFLHGLFIIETKLEMYLSINNWRLEFLRESIN